MSKYAASIENLYFSPQVTNETIYIDVADKLFTLTKS